MSVGKASAASISTEEPLDNHCACTDQPQKDWQQYGGYEPFAEIEFFGIGHMTACSVEAGHAAGILKISLGQRPGARVSRCFSIAFTKWVQHSRHIPLIRALTWFQDFDLTTVIRHPIARLVSWRAIFPVSPL
jgi:hypothetical protein